MNSVLPTSYRAQRRLKLGVVANEFFDLSSGRMGGFGWATRQVARCFNGDSSLGVDVVFLAGETSVTAGKADLQIHGSRVIPCDRNKLQSARRLWAEHIDLLLSIDYRPNYRSIFWSLPRTPILVWVRDPRPPEDVVKIETTRLPGNANTLPKGLKCFDCTSLAGTVNASKWLQRPVLFATPAPFLAAKVPGTYGVSPPDVAFLPNIIDFEPGEVIKSERPSVVFLARLDPYKRPWLFTELAHHFPQVDFIFLGKPHFQGVGAWEPKDLPPNVKLMGHVEGEEKIRLLSSAWVLINTSIHEGLAVSFQEALKCETPLLSCVNPQEVVSRFGIYVGRYDGTGLESIPRLIDGLTRLLNDSTLRSQLGQAGRQWVTETHCKARFLEAFGTLCDRTGVTWQPPSDLS